MTATDELRKLLDERGVEYRKRKDQKGTSLCDVTWWGEPSDCEYIDFGMGRSRFVAYDLTPEQAITATLGSETSSVDDALALLDEMNEQGRIEYADYSQLHDAIAATLSGARVERREE